MTDILRNPRHHFGYIQLPAVIDTLFHEDKEEICWSPSALIEREIYKSEIDVFVRIGAEGESAYIGKVVELRTSVEQRFIKIDTTWCPPAVFEALRVYVKEKRPVTQHRPFLTGQHIDGFVSNVHLEASTLYGYEDDRALDTVLNRIIITLLG